MFKSSVCSYENRGPYGNNKYRGNCSGFIVKDFIESYMRKPNGLVADPSVGGGSSIDVANELGIRFKGTDLHQGSTCCGMTSFRSWESQLTLSGGILPTGT